MTGQDAGAGSAPERLLENVRPHRPRRLAPRELRVEAASAAALLAVAIPLAALGPSSRPLSPGILALYVVLYAAASRVRLYVGAGSALPTQLVFVPMLFELPLGVVPLAVTCALAAGALIPVARGRAHPERVLMATADAWYAVAPVAVLALAGSPPASPGHWPVFLAAFAAQSMMDVLAATAREWAGRAIRPGLQLRVMGSVYAVDALLAPVGLLVAIAAQRYDAAALMAAPLLVLLAVFARDRRRRIERAVARLDELEHERARLQGTIRRVGAAFASTLDREALLALVLDTALDALGAPCGRISANGDVLVRTDAADADLARAVELAEHGPGTLVGFKTAWAIAHPVGSLGTMAVARTGRPFSAEEQELLGYLAGQGAVSLENVRLHQEIVRQATVDELTGLSNHRHLQQALDEELARSSRFPAPVSLLILDIDNFKSVNDTHGHLQGDRVLREVARTVQAHSRRVDEAARYGGEELAVLLRGTRLDGAHHAAETIRRAIEALEVPLDGGGVLRVTASFGVAELDREAHGKNELIAAADAALYQAKRSGKNRTVAAPPVTGTTEPR